MANVFFQLRPLIFTTIHGEGSRSAARLWYRGWCGCRLPRGSDGCEGAATGARDFRTSTTRARHSLAAADIPACQHRHGRRAFTASSASLLSKSFRTGEFHRICIAKAKYGKRGVFQFRRFSRTKFYAARQLFRRLAPSHCSETSLSPTVFTGNLF